MPDREPDIWSVRVRQLRTVGDEWLRRQLARDAADGVDRDYRKEYEELWLVPPSPAYGDAEINRLRKLGRLANEAVTLHANTNTDTPYEWVGDRVSLDDMPDFLRAYHQERARRGIKGLAGEEAGWAQKAATAFARSGRAIGGAFSDLAHMAASSITGGYAGDIQRGAAVKRVEAARAGMEEPTLTESEAASWLNPTALAVRTASVAPYFAAMFGPAGVARAGAAFKAMRLSTGMAKAATAFEFMPIIHKGEYLEGLKAGHNGPTAAAMAMPSALVQGWIETWWNPLARAGVSPSAFRQMKQAARGSVWKHAARAAKAGAIETAEEFAQSFTGSVASSIAAQADDTVRDRGLLDRFKSELGELSRNVLPIFALAGVASGAESAAAIRALRGMKGNADTFLDAMTPDFAAALRRTLKPQQSWLLGVLANRAMPPTRSEFLRMLPDAPPMGGKQRQRFVQQLVALADAGVAPAAKELATGLTFAPDAVPQAPGVTPPSAPAPSPEAQGRLEFDPTAGIDILTGRLGAPGCRCRP